MSSINIRLSLALASVKCSTRKLEITILCLIIIIVILKEVLHKVEIWLCHDFNFAMVFLTRNKWGCT